MKKKKIKKAIVLAESIAAIATHTDSTLILHKTINLLDLLHDLRKKKKNNYKDF